MKRREGRRGEEEKGEEGGRGGRGGGGKRREGKGEEGGRGHEMLRRGKEEEDRGEGERPEGNQGEEWGSYFMHCMQGTFTYILFQWHSAEVLILQGNKRVKI